MRNKQIEKKREKKKENRRVTHDKEQTNNTTATDVCEQKHTITHHGLCALNSIPIQIEKKNNTHLVFNLFILFH